MVLTGTVEEVAEGAELEGDDAAGKKVTVRVVGANDIGKHVTGTVTLTVPGGADGVGRS
jgi:hypothetical protein